MVCVNRRPLCSAAKIDIAAAAHLTRDEVAGRLPAEYGWGGGSGVSVHDRGRAADFDGVVPGVGSIGGEGQDDAGDDEGYSPAGHAQQCIGR
jgi:hypothetical protein